MPRPSKNRPTVLMLLQSDFPPDIRVEKEAQTLLDSTRYGVVLLCNNRKGLPQQETFNGIIIYRLAYWRILGNKINHWKNYPLWFNPIWILKGILLIVKVKPRIIHVHDLPLMFLGLFLARIFNAKLIYDLHENYPATFDLWKKGGIFKPLLRNKRMALWYDRFSLRKADGVIVVEPEHCDWIQRHYGITCDLTVVSNTVDLSNYQQLPIRSELLQGYQDRFVISYVGQISIERDLAVAIRAMAILKNQIKNLIFLIVGEGPDCKRLRKLTHQLQLEDYVVFTGWVPFEDTASYIQLSQVCLIPQGSNDLIDNGTPHKLYQYMALGKPVVVSDAKAMKRIVKETGCGEVFLSGNEQSLAETIVKITHSSVPYGINGQNAVRIKYNWQFSAEVLLHYYSRLWY